MSNISIKRGLGAVIAPGRNQTPNKLCEDMAAFEPEGGAFISTTLDDVPPSRKGNVNELMTGWPQNPGIEIRNTDDTWTTVTPVEPAYVLKALADVKAAKPTRLAI